MDFATADLCDEHGDAVKVVPLPWRCFGQRPHFAGQARTLQVFEDNTLVRRALEFPGDGAVLVVDGGGSNRCALVGDNLAHLAIANGWSGIVVNGCIRDSALIDQMDTGVVALGTCPRKSVKRGEGQENVGISIGGVAVNPGDWIYADADGVLVSSKEL
ncbi:MAG: ribonuclease E activity regulator RraA [Acidimicrobiales bacterium]|nr:ribonuclease E activity regulator RraA [Acidimicrobiales bacterium]